MKKVIFAYWINSSSVRGRHPHIDTHTHTQDPHNLAPSYLRALALLPHDIFLENEWMKSLGGNAVPLFPFRIGEACIVAGRYPITGCAPALCTYTRDSNCPEYLIPCSALLLMEYSVCGTLNEKFHCVSF